MTYKVKKSKKKWNIDYFEYDLDGFTFHPKHTANNELNISSIKIFELFFEYFVLIFTEKFIVSFKLQRYIKSLMDEKSKLLSNIPENAGPMSAVRRYSFACIFSNRYFCFTSGYLLRSTSDMNMASGRQ